MKFPLRPISVLRNCDSGLGNLLVQLMLFLSFFCLACCLFGYLDSLLVPFLVFWGIVCCGMSIIKFFSQMVVTMTLISISLHPYACVEPTFEPYVSNQPPLVEAQSDFQV